MPQYNSCPDGDISHRIGSDGQPQAQDSTAEPPPRVAESPGNPDSEKSSLLRKVESLQRQLKAFHEAARRDRALIELLHLHLRPLLGEGFDLSDDGSRLLLLKVVQCQQVTAHCGELDRLERENQQLALALHRAGEKERQLPLRMIDIAGEVLVAMADAIPVIRSALQESRSSAEFQERALNALLSRFFGEKPKSGEPSEPNRQ